MTDTFELEKRIRSKGLSKVKVAQFLGISAYGFDLKCRNKNEFKASEISKLQSLLELDVDEVQDIFFTK